MNKKILIILIGIFLCTLSIFAKGKKENMSLVENYSFANGYKTAEMYSKYIENLTESGSKKTAVNAFMKGVKAFLKGEELSEEKFKELTEPFEKIHFNSSNDEHDMNEEEMELLSYNKKRAEEFLEENKKRSSVVTTESGLQYEILVNNFGEVVGDRKNIVCNYKMSVFSLNNIIDENDNIEFNLDSLIQGAREGIALMSVGSRYRFYIHPDLGYGDRKVSDDLPAGSLLIFDVELLQIK